MQTVTRPSVVLPAIVITPIRQGVPTTGGTLEVLVRVQAPPPPPDSGSDVTVNVFEIRG